MYLIFSAFMPPRSLNSNAAFNRLYALLHASARLHAACSLLIKSQSYIVAYTTEDELHQNMEVDIVAPVEAHIWWRQLTKQINQLIYILHAVSIINQVCVWSLSSASEAQEKGSSECGAAGEPR